MPPATSAASDGLGRRAASGAAVTMAGQGARILLQVVSIVILARLLSPREYGLFALVMSIVGVSEILRDFGLSNAAIQAKTLSRWQRDNLFWANTALGFGLALLVVAASPLIAMLYREPEVAALACGVAVAFALNGMQTQHRASLNRDLKFLRLTIIDVAAPVVGFAVAIAAALAGWGPWALVAQTVAIAFASLLMLVPAAGWLPGRPRRGQQMSGFYRFGWNMVFTQLINYGANNSDSIIIGIRFGTASAGIYSRAFQLLMNPLNQVRTPVSRVAIPVLSRIQEDGARFADYLVRGQLVLGYTLVAGLALVAGASGPIVTIFLGERWLEAVPVLSLLAVAGAFQTLAFVAYWAFVSQGLTGALFRFTLVSAAVKFSCILIGSQWGIVGVAAGFAAEPLLTWPLAIWWLSRSAPTPVARLMAGAGRMGGLAVVAGLASWATVAALGELPPVAQLALSIAPAAAVYALAALIVPAVRREFGELRHVARLMISRGPSPRSEGKVSA